MSIECPLQLQIVFEPDDLGDIESARQKLIDDYKYPAEGLDKMADRGVNLVELWEAAVGSHHSNQETWAWMDKRHSITDWE